MKERLVPSVPSEFKNVVTLLRTWGFIFISFVEMDTLDRPFCEEVSYARAVSLFFHLPGRGLILNLASITKERQGKADTYCEIRLFFKLERNPDDLSFQARERFWDVWNYFLKLESFGEPLYFELLLNKERPPGQISFKKSKIGNRQLQILHEEIKKMLPFLADQTGRIRTNDFLPIGFFTRSGKLFWDRFRENSHNKSYFYRICT